MKCKKTHIRDIRLFNNAGMSFPVCRRNDELLNLDFGYWPMADAEHATCQKCQERYKKYYSWARGH